MNLFTWLTCIGVGILVFFAKTVVGFGMRKCCEVSESFEYVNGIYNCVEDNTRRLQINTNETGFLHKNTTGQCVEVINDFFVFNVSDQEVLPLGQVNEEVFPKCCPLNYVYNSVIHSCEEQINLDHTYIEQNFVQIGLPNCRVIADYELNGTIDYEYSLQDSALAIHKRNNFLSTSSFCLDQTHLGGYILRECKDSIEVCEEIRCFRKCCPDGQSFINGDFCNDTYKFGLNITQWENVIENPKDPYAIIYGRTCEDNQIFWMDPVKYSFTIDSSGRFFYTVNNETSSEDLGEMNPYCIEYTEAEKLHMNGYYIFKCFGKAVVEERFQLAFYAFVLSCIFLTLTIIVYIILKEIRKIFGKILILYCTATLLESITLAYAASVTSVPTTTECHVIAFAIILFGAAAFTWSNILCWDIWCTFGSTKSYIGTASQKSKDNTKLLLYTCYGWGIPIALALVILFFYEFKDILPDAIQPRLGVDRCFFETVNGNYSKMLFFSFPLLIMEMVNICLFFKTVSYCWRVRNEINKINDTTKIDKTKKYKRDKERLFLILKLSIIMGISFIFEAISGFLNMENMGVIPKYIELIWDIINALQGVYIFLIFICKRKIYNALVNKLLKVHLPQVSISTQSSQTQNGVSLQTLDTVIHKNGK